MGLASSRRVTAGLQFTPYRQKWTWNGATERESGGGLVFPLPVNADTIVTAFAVPDAIGRTVAGSSIDPGQDRPGKDCLLTYGRQSGLLSQFGHIMTELNDSFGKREAQDVAFGPNGSNPQVFGRDLYEEYDGPKDHDPHKPKAPFQQKLTMLVAVILPFVGCIAACILTWRFGWMGWPYLLMMLGGWWITTLGITVGFHRLCTHRSFETFRWLRAGWMILGTLSVEGAPLVWCAVHRRHHGLSDQDGDPHSPNLGGPGLWGAFRGFWHGQVGWLFSGYWSRPELERYVPDLTRDRLLNWINRHYYIWVVLSLVFPAVAGYSLEAWIGVRNPWFGALLGFVWGGLVRIFITHHVTWSINSVCHIFGKRHFHSGDHSTNNAVCAILAMGEGWHNNHHAFPSSARHGLMWYQFDASWVVIRIMKRLGLAWNIKLPSERAMESRRIVG